jgi:glutathione synthase/RimK-type ligase-like ATP-grasp enzyme
VDLMMNTHGDWHVIEVNAVPGWKALGPTCGIDVASCILNHILDSSR